MVVLGGSAVSYERSTPVLDLYGNGLPRKALRGSSQGLFVRYGIVLGAIWWELIAKG